MSKFLTGKDYPHLCSGCRATIDQIAMMLAEAGPDTDDPEAPIMWVYDHRLYCGGHECVNREREQEEQKLTPEWHRISDALSTFYTLLDADEVREWRATGASVVKALPPWMEGMTAADREFAGPK